MKKVITVIVMALGVLLVGWGVNAKIKESAAITIIGGADGPTSVFIAGKIGDGIVGAVILVGIIIIGVGILVYKKLKKQ